MLSLVNMHTAQLHNSWMYDELNADVHWHYTYNHATLEHKSLIDHVFISFNLSHIVHKFYAIEDPLNNSITVLFYLNLVLLTVECYVSAVRNRKYVNAKLLCALPV